MQFKYIDLFAGVGGFHLAFKDLATCVFVSEWDKNAQFTYYMNHSDDLIKQDIKINGDITTINYETEIPNFDILCGGFPCQPFSIAGKQLGFSHETQGNLFYNIVDIIKAKSPSVLFLENVKNLQSHDGGNTFKVILKTLKDLGYYVKYQVLNGSLYGGVPQNRERIFIVGFKEEKYCSSFVFPEKIELSKKIEDCLLKDKQPLKYYQTNMSSEAVKKMVEGVTKKNTIYQYRRYYVRENKTSVCPTLTANMGTGGHNVPLIKDDFGVRKLTPRECFNFQGYPLDFKLPAISDSHLYKQAGNSVVVPLVARIASEIIKVLKIN